MSAVATAYTGSTAIALGQKPAMIEQPRRARTSFCQSIHLRRRRQADLLLDFLRLNDAEEYCDPATSSTDVSSVQRTWYCRKTTATSRSFSARPGRVRGLRMCRDHDEFLRDFTGTHFGVEVVSAPSTTPPTEGC
jgi:hypothetical protein